ncbi:MAG: DNA helicase RecQ [Planctomycetaceae bacterium]|nr:DNA helicase RecQ [Planctomycetaceae bacterium]
MTTVTLTEQTDESRLLSAMQQYWGYDTFRPLQREAMQSVMQNRDSVVVLPTGGGKSLCFQVPALCRDGLALVVSPLISLMKDQVDALRSCGVSAAYINSMLTYEERVAVSNDVRAGRLQLLYVAPERLLQEKTLALLESTGGISLVAIDEAHCISQWGHDFRPEYRALSILKDRFAGAAVHAYTATATEQVRHDIANQLGLNDPNILVGSFDRPNLIYKVARRSGLMQRLAETLDRHNGESGIIYCISRKEVERISASLNELGYKTRPYHAGMSDEARKQNQEAFIQEEADTIVATVAFGMGIDKSNVRYVIHAGMPKSLEHYQQESGRAGRDGLEAECLLFFSEADYVTWQRIIQDSEPQSQGGAIQSLQAISNFCTSVVCRHRSLVNHFGQDFPEKPCNACDICLGDVELAADPLVTSQKILSCVYRQGQRFGGDYTALVLKGSKDQRILSNGHDQLSTYGLLTDIDRKTIRDWIEQLVSQGFLIKAGEYNVLQLTESAREVMRGEVTPALLKARKKTKERESKIAAESWEGVDQGLFDELRKLRRDLAEDRGVPAYIIFGDATLRDLARKRPSNLGNFRNAKGVGEKKLKDFGEVFVDAIISHCRQHDLDTDVGASKPKVEKPKPARNIASSSALRSFEYFRQGLTITEVAAKMDRAPSTVTGYLSEFIQHEKETDATKWLDEATIREIDRAIEAVGDEKLSPIFNHLDGKVEYSAIRIVLACAQNAHAE